MPAVSTAILAPYINNPFTPEFRKWFNLSLNLETSVIGHKDFNQTTKKKNKNRITNSIDQDEMAHYEPSHLNHHCLQITCI